MNYILLNNMIFNHKDLNDNKKLSNCDDLTEKVLNNFSCYSYEDYQDLIDEICGYFSDKPNETLIVGTFFYKLPCFTELLSSKLNNVKIVPLINYFIENCNGFINDDEFVFNEVYSNFTIKTICKVANKTLTIVSQKLEQFDFENKLIEKIQWSDNSLSNVKKYKSIDEVISINSYLSEFYCYFSQINMGYATDHLLLYNEEYFLSIFYHDVIEILKKNVNCKNKQLIFNILLYLKDIRKKTDDIWEKCWINTTEKHTDYKNVLKIEEALFETQTLPYKRKFTSAEKFWLFAETKNFGCSFVRENSRESHLGNFCTPNDLLSKIVFTVNNKRVAKLFLDIKRDCFNNLNITTKIENKLFYNKIDFWYE